MYDVDCPHCGKTVTRPCYRTARIVMEHGCRRCAPNTGD